LGRTKSASLAAETVEEVEATFDELAAAPVVAAPVVTEMADPEGAAGSDAPAGAGRGQATPNAARPGRASWALVGCVFLALASLVFALLALQQRRSLQTERSQTNELRDVSGRTIAALTTYDYQHLDQWKQAVLADSTGAFHDQFASAFTGLEPAYVAEHNRGTGAVQGVWVGPVDAGKATAVVLVQITVTSLTGTHSLNPYIQVTLLKVAGRWRVDDVQATFDTGAGTGASSTVTTLPAPTPTSTP
jgi:hypothetical protein